MIVLSPGLLQGCVELLGIISKSRLSIPEIRTAFAAFGGLPTVEVVKTVQALNWILVNEHGLTEVSNAGARLIGASTYELMLRRAILDYVEVERPPWLQAAQRGRAPVLAFAGSKIAQVMVEAGLNSEDTPDVVTFWDELAALARGQRDATLSKIGRVGERLSLAYEKTRTGHRPKWIALEDNEDGYDVLSVREKTDARPLSIETKTSTMGLFGRIHMTRNEWDRAVEFDLHLFHLWDISSRIAPRLAVVSVDEMNVHIPSDRGNGMWCAAEIPFALFAGRFAVPSMALLTDDGLEIAGHI